ncbi:hypothetical protein Pan216_05700 [Planctomycetes bacterium Pan216]|uniref:Uncharacterized protein n=1 Tax=Kolteria novifilia TaxID=2527975 RepID=A0A518AYD9_9BACT|nr:hypothetical protein Pan216_05700 [Planctomycetes bacterium Pan216]
MSDEKMFAMDEWELALLDGDFIEGFKGRYGTHREGYFEDDPEQLAYEEMVALGQSLGSREPW